MNSLPTDPEGPTRARANGDAAEPARDGRKRDRTGRVLLRLAKSVADAEPAEIEESARRLGRSRRFLAPVAWAAGAIVLLVRGVKLLLLNWRLLLIEMVPAAWVWLVVWDLKQHALRDETFRQPTFGRVTLLVVIAVSASIASFWCNTIFGFAISDPPPRIRPAATRAREHRGRIVRAGVFLGIAVAAGAIGIPRIDRLWLYLVAAIGLDALMVISFVAVPARILEIKKRRQKPMETVGRWTLGGLLSAVAMTPGLLLDRVGLILLGSPHLRLFGFVLLSIGTALYAAGMSSVKAVKLSMRLDDPDRPHRSP